MADEIRVLIVGGYGVFGGRIVELLENEPRLTLIVAGRSRGKAEAFCAARQGVKAALVPEAFDRDGDLPTSLAALRPDILIDASGPFQAYGEGRYRVIEACIAAGVNYLDLADGSDFVAGVAVAGYAGQPVQLVRDGKTATGYPFTEHMRYTIALPGHVPVSNTLFSLVDVPDLRALRQLWPQAKRIWMGAGPVPEVLHRLLIALAWLVRWRLLPGVSALAPLMHFCMNNLQRGEHRGGMFVEVEGVDSSGIFLKRSWHMLAEGDGGPFIPSMAVEALVRRAVDGQKPAPGARAALRELALEDYEKLFSARVIHCAIRQNHACENAQLYARLCGACFASILSRLRAMARRGLRAPRPLSSRRSLALREAIPCWCG